VLPTQRSELVVCHLLEAPRGSDWVFVAARGGGLPSEPIHRAVPRCGGSSRACSRSHWSNGPSPRPH